MSSMHCPRAVGEAKDCEGYVVCDNMEKGYPYAKQVLSQQLTLTMKDDEGKTVQVPWDRSCIWVCDEWDDPRKWSEDMKEFISKVCTVFDMYESEWEYLYGEDEDESDEDEDEDELDETSGKRREGKERKEKGKERER